MEKFKFNYYDNSIKKIKCIYTYDGIVRNNSSWEGYIITQNVDGLLNIEGYEKDNMDSLERSGNPHLRYILGTRAISYANGTLIFEIYPGNIAPIHYDMHYSEEDGCFYGNWFLVPTENHPHPHSGGQGEAIISIEDVIIDEKEVTKIIKKVADRSENEYSEEIETYEFLSQKYELLSHRQVSLFDNDSANAVKKLSKYSDIIIKK